MLDFIKKEWLLAIRSFQDLVQPLFFIFILVIIFPLSIGVNDALLHQVASGIIWIAVLLSVLLASEKYFKTDFEDGSLEQIMLSGNSMLSYVFAKILVQWVVQILPILLSLPLFGIFYKLSFNYELQIALSLIIGSFSLLLFAMLGAALTLSISRSSMLSILLILPLYIPTLVFALSAISAYNEGFSNIGQFSILGAILMATLATTPFAISASLKVSLHN